MIRISAVSVITAIRGGERQSLLRWREREIGMPQKVREKRTYWFADRAEAIEVRDAMRLGETFEMAFALMQARAGTIAPSIKALGHFVPGYHDY